MLDHCVSTLHGKWEGRTVPVIVAVVVLVTVSVCPMESLKVSLNPPLMPEVLPSPKLTSNEISMPNSVVLQQVSRNHDSQIHRGYTISIKAVC